MGERELYKRVAKEIIPKLDEIADICKDNGIDRVSWIDVTKDGYINFRMSGCEFMRVKRNGKLILKYEEEV